MSAAVPVELEAGLEGVCALCEHRLARRGSAVCAPCWTSLRSERNRRPSVTYCECGGGELHRLCGRQDYRA